MPEDVATDEWAGNVLKAAGVGAGAGNDGFMNVHASADTGEDAPSLEEENRELKRLIRDLVHYDIKQIFLPPTGHTDSGEIKCADQSNKPQSHVDWGFYELPLAIQAELQILDMQQRFQESTQYIKR